MKQKKLHMIGNAHLDPVWLWQWQEGFQEVKATFRSALDRMKEYDDFIFTCSSAVFYEWVEKNAPDMFEEIKQRVAEGRWKIVGGWWIQPDCNIPSGESFVRQALYAQRYFKEKFGIIAKVGYNVDSFGHHGMLPQILKKSGMDYYVFMRPMPLEKGLPGRIFWWESDDGTRVLTFRILYEYCTWGKDIEKHVRRCMDELQDPIDELMCFYGVGNHGGGPTKENIESIHKLNRDKELPQLVMSSPQQYFEKMVEKGTNFPVVHDDLQHHASGCYAAHSGVKKWNRQAENLLLTAEKYSVIADAVTGQAYPDDFKQAWKNVLFNQFHDIMAGTSLEVAYEDARNMYGEAMSIAGRNLNYALQSISWNINIEENQKMKPIVVFNPHSWPGKMNVELEYGRFSETDILVDEQGAQVPIQTVQSHATANGRNRLSFTADLPPMGYRVYKVVSEPTQPAKTFAPLKANDYAMENQRFRIEFNPESGYISSLYDKKEDFEVLKGEGAKPCVMDDPSDTWSHNVFKFDKEIGQFKASSVKLIEHGPVKATIQVTSEYGKSKLIQKFSMYRELEQIEVNVTVDWREEFKMLKLKFPVNLAFRKATYEIPYGHIEKASNGEEEPGQSWIDFSGEAIGKGKLYGLSIMNDAKYSYDFNINEMGLTVLRSPIYAHHDPATPQEGRHYSFIDQGIQHFSYSLLPHTGSWQSSRVVQCAAELNQKPIAIVETYHNGVLPQKQSFISVDADNVIVSAFKQAEDGDGIIVRCYEAHKKKTKARIELPKWNRVIEAEFGPCEIKTFKIPHDASLPVQETNLLEWAQ